MADLFNKKLLDINVNLYIRIFGITNIGLTNSKMFSHFRILQKVVFKKQNFNRLGNVKIQCAEINEKVKKSINNLREKLLAWTRIQTSVSSSTR